MRRLRRAFWGRDRGAVSSLKKLLIRIEDMDTRASDPDGVSGVTYSQFRNTNDLRAMTAALIVRCTAALAARI